MARRTVPPKMKLRHRLPNAPPVFVGRAKEIEWLDHALRRGAVVAVTGPGGMGKTALVLRTLSVRFPDHVDRTVYFQIRPGEPTAQLRYDLVRVLSEVARRPVDLAALATDPEALVEAAIDLAESADLWIMLDDTHHADVEEMSELLTQLSTYARNSRWLVTSRMDPPVAALRGQVLGLGAMEEADLATLAHDLSPEGGTMDLHRAVVASSGNPWLLHQYVATGDAGAELTRARLVGDLPDSIEPFLYVLSLFRVPVDVEVLARLATIPDARALDALTRRGLVVSTSAGLSLHDVVAQILYPSSARPRDDAARREQAAAVLEATGDAESLVTAARLYLEAGALDSLVALLDAHMDDLLAEAQAPRLFSAIGETRDPRLVRHQLRCAAELGNPTALGAVREPLDPGLEEELAWATTTYGKGEVDDARSLAGQIRAAAEQDGDARLSCEAALLEARCLLHQHEPVRAARLLEPVQAHTPALAFRRDALLARCRVVARDPSVDGALGELRRRGEAMSDGLDGLLDIAAALHTLGRLEGADEVLDVLLATPRGGRASLLVSRNALLLRARIRLDAGDVALAGELVSTLQPYVRTTSLLRPFVFELDATRRFAVGDLHGLTSVLHAGLKEAMHVDRGLALRLATLAERLAMESLEALTTIAAPITIDPTDASIESATLGAVRARRALRAGATHSGPMGAMETAGVDHSLLLAERALLGGDAPNAVHHAQEAWRRAARTGSRLAELDALGVYLDALTIAGLADAANDARSALHDLAQGMSSTRARLRAELAERFSDLGTLERIAPHATISPVAARRARALLGGAPMLDAVDIMVVEAWQARAPTRVEIVLGQDPRLEWQSGWGLDARAHSVWLADGRTVDLSTKGLLWRLLDALVAHGGSATKEELIVGVWEERVYHPGRHDPRLHMSARKLREVLEDDPGSPTRLLTTDDGYRLAGLVRRVAT